MSKKESPFMPGGQSECAEDVLVSEDGTATSQRLRAFSYSQKRKQGRCLLQPEV